MSKIIENIRLLNIDILIDFFALAISIYSLRKQASKIKIESLFGNYFIDNSRGCDENGNPFIEMLPFIRIINNSQMPTTIYSIEIALKNNNLIFKTRMSSKKTKEIHFINRNLETMVIRNLLDFTNPINLEAYQILSGHLDYWINGTIDDLDKAKIIIKTSRGKVTKKIKFKEINNDSYRDELI